MRNFKKYLAALLTVTLFFSCMPMDQLSAALAEAVQEADRAAAVVAEDFAAYPELAARLAGEGQTLASGSWRYVRLPETDYAAIVGYEGAFEAELEMPELLDGLDTVAVAPGALAGLKGLECFHPSASPEQSELLVEYADKYGLMITEGSDIHSPNHLRDYSRFHKP